ncbi:MAG: D-TA family PLP-dependent enzyme [Williamsia sp.]|nr:D-TA family PLP-dependent enzyme [Williamsia sp.]
MNSPFDWYTVHNIDTLDSPALLVYKKRIEQNILWAVNSVGSADLLRPHVKTCKIAEVCNMMLEAGITKFKCATIAEAEMLATTGAPDVLLAYQPVGPKVKRLLALVQRYPQTSFSCLVDDEEAAGYLSQCFEEQESSVDVFIDLNTGMNRSGIQPANTLIFFKQLKKLPGIRVAGTHAYDGHIHDADVLVRMQKTELAFGQATTGAAQIEKYENSKMKIIAGGSVSFPFHRQRGVECSPGTFVFWDWGYKQLLPEEPFRYAALVVTRVISIVDATTITTDLGHKSVAAENPLPRVHFLNAPHATPVAQSEEHLVLKVSDSTRFRTGDVLYGVPVHICPTVALYEKAAVIENHQAVASWRVIARDRSIGI